MSGFGKPVTTMSKMKKCPAGTNKNLDHLQTLEPFLPTSREKSQMYLLRST